MCVYAMSVCVGVCVCLLILALTTSQPHEDDPKHELKRPLGLVTVQLPHYSCVPHTFHTQTVSENQPSVAPTSYIVRYCTGRKRSHSPAFHSNRSTCWNSILSNLIIVEST